MDCVFSDLDYYIISMKWKVSGASNFSLMESTRRVNIVRNPPAKANEVESIILVLFYRRNIICCTHRIRRHYRLTAASSAASTSPSATNCWNSKAKPRSSGPIFPQSESRLRERERSARGSGKCSRKKNRVLLNIYFDIPFVGLHPIPASCSIQIWSWRNCQRVSLSLRLFLASFRIVTRQEIHRSTASIQRTIDLTFRARQKLRCKKNSFHHETTFNAQFQGNIKASKPFDQCCTGRLLVRHFPIGRRRHFTAD